jgi:F0F1-type ATP synthase assembly protein I
VGDSPSDKYKGIRQLGLLSAIPLILAAAPLIGYFIGTKIDHVLGTNRVFMFVFLGLGFVAGVRETIQLIRKAEQDD